MPEFCIVGGVICCNPTKSATALSNALSNVLSYDEEIARISQFCQLVEMHFQHLAGPGNTSCVDLKCDVLCL